MQNKEIKYSFQYIAKVLGTIIAYAAFSSVLMLVVMADVVATKNVLEGGMTEKIQIILIAGAGVLYSLQAIKSEKFRNCNSLTAIMFLLFFIRELDAFFDDLFFHGAWFYIVLIVLLSTFLYFRKRIKETVFEFVDFTKTPRFILIVFGLISLLLLSRLFGYKEVWKTFFNKISMDNAVELNSLYRPCKNLAEEGVEIISYLALFLSALNPFAEKEPLHK